jgi:hypothetical protein
MKIRTYTTIARPVVQYGRETWTHRESGIHSDNLGKKDFMENLQTKM